MKRLVVMTLKEWKTFKQNVAADTVKLMNEEYLRGRKDLRGEIDLLTAALVTAMSLNEHETGSIDVNRSLVGKVRHGVLNTGDRLVIHTYPKSLLPD